MPPTKRTTHNRIQRGSGVYRCAECGKLTRDTGQGEAPLDLCFNCMERSEWENFLADGGDPDQVPEKYHDLIEE